MKQPQAPTRNVGNMGNWWNVAKLWESLSADQAPRAECTQEATTPRIWPQPLLHFFLRQLRHESVIMSEKIGLSNVEQSVVASARSSNFQAERAQCHCASLRHSAANAMYMSHLTIWHKASSGCYYTCHTLDNSWTESPLHRHDRGTPPADEGVICTQIRWKPLQSPRWNAICFAHTAWTPWRSDFPLGSDQARNKVRVWLRACWKGQADPKFGCLINKD
jgi:hypothetical protein